LKLLREPEAWLNRRSVGGKAHALNGGRDAPFMTKSTLDQLNQFSPCQPLKKYLTPVLPLAATLHHKPTPSGVDMIRRNMTRIETLKSLEKQV